MKIGFILDDTLDTPDGVQQYVLALGGWLSAQGHEVHYLVGQTTRTDIPHVHSLSHNLRVKFNGNRMSMPLPVWPRRLGRLLHDEQFDVLHVQMPYSPLLAHRLLLAAPARTALVATFHVAPDAGIVGYATRGLGLWTRRSVRRLDRIVSVSSAAADFARQTYGVESEVLPNVVDVARFATARPYKKYADIPTVMFLGRLVPRKGCGLLLEAVRLLRASEPRLTFRVVVCGRGPLEAELKQFARASGIDDIIEFTGFVSEADKVRYLRSADLAVFPSSGGESFGIVLIEAMAAAHPVVLGADNPGYRAVLGPYPDELFPVGDADTLATKIRTYLTDSGLHRRARDWQSEYVRQFDIATVGRQLLSYYDEACQKRTGTGRKSVR